MKKMYKKFTTILAALILILILLFAHLLGFIVGYTKNSTQHKFIFEYGDNVNNAISLLEKMNAKFPTNKTCLEGCYYLWYRSIEDIPTRGTILQVGNYTRNDCDKFCNE